MSCQQFALSLAQQDVYYEHVFKGDSAEFNIGGTIELKGAKAPQILAAHEKLVRSNDVFRLQFYANTTDPSQSLSRELNFDLELVDVRQASDPVSAAKTHITQMFETPLHFSQGELYKVALVQVGSDHFYYVGLMHHIAIDGLGFANWAQQIIDNTYGHRDYVDSSWSSLVDADIEKRGSARFKKSQDYWQTALQGEFSNLFKQKYKSNRSIRKAFDLPESTLNSMRAMFNNHQWSFPQQLLAAFSATFSLRYGASRFLVTEVFHHRRSKDEKSKVGFFAGESPLIIDTADCQSFNELVDKNTQQQRTKLKLFNIGKRNIQNIMRAQGLDQDVEQLSFNYIKVKPLDDGKGNDVPLLYFPHNHEPLPFRLNVWEQFGGNAITLEVDFNEGYLNESEVDAIVAVMTGLLEQAETDNTLGFNEIETLTANEKTLICEQGLLSEFQHELPAAETFSRTLYQCVCDIPEQVALHSKEGSITYKQLWDEAVIVASQINDLSFPAHSIIAIETRKTSRYFIEMLGIILSGHAFMPIDPKLTFAEVEKRVVDVDCKAMLSVSDQFNGLEVEYLQLEASHPSPLCDDRILKLRDIDSLTYIMHSSGSTGSPKAIPICDRHVSNKMFGAMEGYDINTPQRVLQLSSLSFDVVIEELFIVLLSRGTFVIPSRSVREFDELAKEIAEHKITLASFSTALFHHLAVRFEQHHAEAMVDSLKIVLVVGEKLQVAPTKNWLEMFPSGILFNTYGPTETTIKATYHRISASDIQRNEIPIGKPFISNPLMVVNELGLPAPVGAEGELLIGGNVVSDGYLSADKENANSAFIQTHFFSENNQTWYKSGDFVYWNEHKELVFVRRKDDQIKLSGIRTSESWLTQLLTSIDGVKSGFIFLVPETKQLFAFVVAEGNGMGQTDKLSAAILATLPYYAQPTIHYIDEMPLNINGKVDKQALRLMSQAQHYEQSCSETEELVVAMATAILGHDGIDLDSSFYQLGGNSLNAIEFTKKIESKFAISFSLELFLSLQSVRKVAAYIDDVVAVKQVEASSDEAFSVMI